MSIRIAVPHPWRKGLEARNKPPEAIKFVPLEVQRRVGAPVIFGSAMLQELLLDVARNGNATVGERDAFHRGLVTARICVEDRSRPSSAKATLRLNGAHPAISEIVALLGSLSGEPVIFERAPGSDDPHPERPLAHIKHIPFRLMLAFVQAGGALDEEAIRRRVPDLWPSAVGKALDRLVEDGVFVEGEGRTFVLDARLPDSFNALVLRLASLIDDPRFQATAGVGARPTANQHAVDGAPRLFGTDARLRNLMALALHGPMLYRDLRRITGAYHLHGEGRDDAPFGRAALVRMWETNDGPAVMIDNAHPLALPLKRLLLRLAEIYPLPPHVPAFDVPVVPRARAWRGDKLAFFGNNIPTNVLFSIGVYGWTFEALCCHFAGLHRENIKSAMMRLEEEGVLEGDRPRKPGANVRVVRIAESFPAKAELEELLREGAQIWGYVSTVQQVLDRKIPPKTHVQLLRRGLWPGDLPAPVPAPPKKRTRLSRAKKRSATPFGQGHAQTEGCDQKGRTTRKNLTPQSRDYPSGVTY